MSIIDALRKFCDGTGLDPFEIDELNAAGYIAQNLQDRSWFVTQAGHVALQQTGQLALHVEDGDHSQCADEDSYHPPRPGRNSVMQAALEEHRSALNVQEGGDHYKNLKIQPVEFIEANGIPFLEGCVIKRMCRHGSKAKAEDLRKAIHEITLLLELRYGEKL